jgi:hypothetical protein
LFRGVGPHICGVFLAISVEHPIRAPTEISEPLYGIEP